MKSDPMLLIHIFCTFNMTGIIWLIQCVHYPIFEFIASEHQKKTALKHQKNISWLVVPLMIVELFTGFFLYLRYASDGPWMWKFNFYLIVIAWLCTFLIQVPIHQKMIQGFELKDIRKLVHSNWIRTVVWTLRSGILLIYLTYFGMS